MKKICFLGLLLAGLVVAPVAGQTGCDTIIAKNGERIAADIVRSDRSGILYRKCGSAAESRYFISMEKVAGVKQGEKLPPVVKTPPLKKPPSDKKVPVRISPVYIKRIKTAQETTPILWIAYSVALDVGARDGASVGFHFGAEAGLKNFPLRVNLVLRLFEKADRPYGLSEEFTKDGPNREMGLAFKKFTVGPLSGHTSNAYWGIQFLVGRKAYAYHYGVSPPEISRLGLRWIKVLPCVGYQIKRGRMAFDMALPVGYQSTRFTHSGDYADRYWSDTFCWQPSIALGWHF